MRKRIYDPEILKLKEMTKLYAKQAAKIYKYDMNEFSIDLLSNKWKHKSWKTWMKGGEDYESTKNIVEQYINECRKPYAKRDLSKFHLA